jgi:hypothetical protein
VKDLVLMVADKNAHYAIHGALSRPEAVGIHSIKYDFRVHPRRDAGARTEGPDLLASESRRFRHALLIFDYEGSGAKTSPLELEAELNQKLALFWQNRAKTIVIAPEVDIWIWGSENKLREILKWNHTLGIREWLIKNNFEINDSGKPARPKEAIELVLRHLKIPRSSSLYHSITSQISLQQCTDNSFKRLREILRTWFPAS